MDILNQFPSLGGADGLTAVVGEWDRSVVSEPLPHQEVGLEQVVVHPQHSAQPMAFDNAIVILSVSTVDFPLFKLNN